MVFRSVWEFNDNILLLALDKATVRTWEQTKYTTPSPIHAAWGYDPGFEEYLLTDEILSRLGVSFEGKRYLIDREDLVRYQVYIHVDCFFFIKPIERVLLKELVHCILQQHSFYLGVEVDWSGVLDTLIERVGSSPKVEMKSDPKHKRLMIPGYDDRSVIRKPLKPSPGYSISIQDGKAYLDILQSK